MSRADDEVFFREIEVNIDRIRSSPVENNLSMFLECRSTSCDAPLLDPRPEIIGDVVGFASGVSGNSKGNRSLAKVRCFEPWRSMTVDAGGGVMQCCTSSLSLIGMNVTEHSLGDIWRSARYNGLRARFLNGELPTECEHNCFPSIRYSQKLLADALREATADDGGGRKDIPARFLGPVTTVDRAYEKITGKRGKLEDILRNLGCRIVGK